MCANEHTVNKSFLGGGVIIWNFNVFGSKSPPPQQTCNNWSDNNSYQQNHNDDSNYKSGYSKISRLEVNRFSCESINLNQESNAYDNNSVVRLDKCLESVYSLDSVLLPCTSKDLHIHNEMLYPDTILMINCLILHRIHTWKQLSGTPIRKTWSGYATMFQMTSEGGLPSGVTQAPAYNVAKLARLGPFWNSPPVECNQFNVE